MNRKIKQLTMVVAVGFGATFIPKPLYASVPGSTTLALQADEITVKGNVVDENGESIIGATVMQKGTNNATVTDLNGNFALKVPSGVSLVISYIGFTTQTVKASTSIKVTLKEENTKLNEVRSEERRVGKECRL